MINVTIDRKRWGTGQFGCKLLDSKTKKMCCLGFVMRQAGYPAGCIEDMGMPEDVVINDDKIKPRALCILEPANRPIVRSMAGVNDVLNLPNREREKQIAMLGKEIGINFKFVGKNS